LKINTERLPDCQIALSVEPDQKTVQDALQKAARQLSRTRNVPGFRKGKAPYAVVVRTFGKNVLYEQIVEKLGEKSYKEALEESKLEPIAPGVLEEIQLDPLVFLFHVPMPPEVDLADYRALRVERAEVVVEDEEIQSQLNALQDEQSEWVPVDDEPAAYGDLLTMTLRGVIGEDMIVEDDAFELNLTEEEDKAFPPGFEAQFVGQQTEAELSFDLIYPEDWEGERAGAEAHFDATILSIKRHETPPLDDEFAPLIGDYDTLDELKDSLRQGILEQRQAEANNRYANDVLLKMIEGSAKIEYPPIVLAESLDRLVDEQKRDLERVKLPFAEYLRMTGSSEEDFREQFKPVAENRLRSDLVLEELIKLEKLKVSAEEIDDEMSRLLNEAADNESLRDLLTSDGGRLAVAQTLLRTKAVDRMVAIADGTAPALAESEAAVEGEAETEVAGAEAEAAVETEAAVQTEPETAVEADPEAAVQAAPEAEATAEVEAEAAGDTVDAE